MPRPKESPRFIVLCPLAHEARAARAALRGFDGDSVQVLVAGPGGDAIRTCFQRSLELAGSPLNNLRSILFGTCGGLRPLDIGNHTVITEVKDESGRRWTPPMKLRGNTRILLSVTSPLFSATAKQTTGEKFQADLVDCESAAFADSCESAGVRWGVVRGVSDDVNDELPAEAANWIDESGMTRVGRVMADCLRSPRLIPRVVRLGRRSGAALREAGEQLRAMIEAELKTDNRGNGCDA